MTTVAAHVAIAAVCALLSWMPAQAHDFWIEPGAFSVPGHQRVSVGLLVGEHFKGEPFARDGRRIVEFAAYGPGGRTSLVGVEGRHPAGMWRPGHGGAYILGYRSNRAHAELPREKFATYLVEQGLEGIAAQLPAQAGPVREAYSRYAKALVGVDGPAKLSDDRRLGWPFEIVAEDDTFRVWFDDRPLANVLVIALSEQGDQRLTVRTDAQGRARLALGPGSWLVTAVHMIAAPADADAQWESFWGSLRFELPKTDRTRLSMSLSTHTPKGIERLDRMRDDTRGRGWYRCPRRRSGDFTNRNIEMSSSNLAVRLEHAAADALSQSPRPEVREAANDERMVKSVRRRVSFTNRKFVVHDQGLRLFRIR